MKLEQYAMAAMTALINTNDFLHEKDHKYTEVSVDDTCTHMSHRDGPIMPMSSFSLEGHEDQRRFFIETPREVRVAKLSFKYAQAMINEQNETN